MQAASGRAVCVLGSWSAHAVEPTNLDLLIHLAVRGALACCDFGLEAVDCVITVSSDTADGAIAPLLRAEAAGARGRDYLNFTGASAAALHAAVSMIEAGLAATVLVVGWGEWTKPVVDDMGALATDPVLQRPLGIGSLQLASPRSISQRACIALLGFLVGPDWSQPRNWSELIGGPCAFEPKPRRTGGREDSAFRIRSSS